MGQTVSDFLVRRLHDWGVRRVYGFPGDGINGIMGALNRAEGGKHGLDFIQARHEELAAFMACAHAKFTGQVGVCMATSGPGAIHLLNGLYDARKDHQPVVAIVGQQAATALGSFYQQEVDLITLFKDVASDYVHMVSSPVAARHQIDSALRIAIANKTVTCVILPNDIQEEDAPESIPRSHGTTLSGVGYHWPEVVPREADLDRAAEILNAGERVAMLVGAGALHATDELMAVAERLGAGVAKALLGKAVIPDDVPYVTGSIGLLGTKPSWDLMMNCDTLLMVGSSFPYAEFLPKEGQARGVQIDIKPQMLNLRYPMEAPLQGDAKLTLQRLLPKLRQKDGWRADIERQVADWWKLMEDRANLDADPINPQKVFWDVSPRLPDNCIIASDSGSSANWFARDLKVRRGMMASLSGGLATMCPGVPYAFAAKMAFPERVAIAFVGDGAMQMLGNNGLITISDHWQDWSDPRLIVCVLNNGDLNQVTWEQRVMAGDPKFETSQNLPRMNYAQYGESLGLKGIRVEKPDALHGAWDEALRADRPVVLDVLTDPEVPPLPPHITFKQAKGFMFSILKGDPAAGDVIKRSFKQMATSLLPG